MKKLLEILCELRDVEYMLESMAVIMKVLEKAFVNENEELYRYIHYFRRMLDVTKKEMGETLSDLDQYMLECNKG